MNRPLRTLSVAHHIRPEQLPPDKIKASRVGGFGDKPSCTSGQTLPNRQPPRLTAVALRMAIG